MNDVVRAAIMSVVTSGVSLGVLLGLLHLDGSQTAAITLFVNNVVILGALVFKKGQSAGPPSNS